MVIGTVSRIAVFPKDIGVAGRHHPDELTSVMSERS